MTAYSLSSLTARSSKLFLPPASPGSAVVFATFGILTSTWPASGRGGQAKCLGIRPYDGIFDKSICSGGSYEAVLGPTKGGPEHEDKSKWAEGNASGPRAAPRSTSGYAASRSRTR